MDLQCTQQYLAFFDFSYKFNSSVLCFQYGSFKKQEAFVLFSCHLLVSFQMTCVLLTMIRDPFWSKSNYTWERHQNHKPSFLLGGIGYYGHFTIIQVMNLKFLEQHLQHPQEKIKIKIKIKIETSEKRNNWTNRLLHATVIKQHWWVVGRVNDQSKWQD